MNDVEFVNSLKKEVMDDLSRYFNTINTPSIEGGYEPWNDSKEL